MNNHRVRLTPNEVLRKLKSTSGALTDELRLKNCLEQPFEAMPVTYRKKLVKLSVFQSAPFDVKGVSIILGEDKSSKEQTELDMLYLKSRHLIELETFKAGENGRRYTQTDNEKATTSYSFHPFVSTFLKDLQEDSKYSTDSADAKYRFISYIKNVLYEAGKASNDDYIVCQTMLENNGPHIAEYFKYLRDTNTGVITPLPTNKPMSIVHEAVITGHFLNNYEQVSLFKRQSERANCNGNEVEYIFYKSQEGECYLRLDWMDDARSLLGELENRVEPNRSELGEKLQKLAVAFYFQLKGHYLRKLQRRVEALDALGFARDLLTGLEKKIHLLTIHAEIINSIGCIHYDMKHYTNALECHTKAVDMITKSTARKFNFNIPHYMVNIGTVLHVMGTQTLHSDRTKGEEYLNEALNWYNKSLQLERDLNIYGLYGTSHKLKVKAEICRILENYEDALEVAAEALRIQETISHAPHPKITLYIYCAGKIYFEWSKSLRRRLGITERTLELDKLSLEKYDQVMNHIKIGGLSCDHVEYSYIKVEHRKLLERLQQDRKLEKVNQFYRDFENGRYERRINKALKSVKQKSVDKDVSADESSSSSLDNDESDESRPTSSDLDEDDIDPDPDRAVDFENLSASARFRESIYRQVSDCKIESMTTSTCSSSKTDSRSSSEISDRIQSDTSSRSSRSTLSSMQVSSIEEDVFLDSGSSSD